MKTLGFQPRHLVALVLGSRCWWRWAVPWPGWDCYIPRRGSMRSWSPVENGGRVRDHHRNDLAVFGCDGAGRSVGRPLPAVRPSRMTTLGRVASQGITSRGRPVLWSAYSLRNLWARRVTTLLTLLGLWPVVFVFVAILMLAYGLSGRWAGPGSRQRDCDEFRALSLKSKAACRVIRPGYRRRSRRSSPWQTIRLRRCGRLLCNSLCANRKAGSPQPASHCVARRPMPLRCVPWCISFQGRLWQPGTTEVIVGTQVAVKQFP